MSHPRLALLGCCVAAAAGALASAATPPLRSAPPPPPPMAKAQAHPLSWDAMKQTYTAKPGEHAADFIFAVTNTSSVEVEIRQLHPSCGCTLAQMPTRPWVLAPGAKEAFTATLDFKGKSGTLAKTIVVDSSHGSQTLTVAVEIPEMDAAARVRNQDLARANRQLVFQNECAACHAAPLAGKTGAELFQAACGICHLAAERASIVPDLFAATTPRDEATWRKWIIEGKDGTLMPAFAQTHGGPLSNEQVDSLVAFLVTLGSKRVDPPARATANASE